MNIEEGNVVGSLVEGELVSPVFGYASCKASYLLMSSILEFISYFLGTGVCVDVIGRKFRTRSLLVISLFLVLFSDAPDIMDISLFVTFLVRYIYFCYFQETVSWIFFTVILQESIHLLRCSTITYRYFLFTNYTGDVYVYVLTCVCIYVCVRLYLCSLRRKMKNTHKMSYFR